MTKLAYVSCPLEAALAAKNFGIKFGTPITDDEDDNESWWPMYYNPDERFCGVFVRDSGDAAIANKYYIADESLSLLHHQDGDLLMATPSFGGGLPHMIIANSTDVFRDDVLIKIIQRDNKPFPKIEWEESDDR